jgi:RNA polymerase sigma-54 factor
MRQQLIAKQIQNLSLTPEIKQSLRFLGLNTVDLLEELKSIALENPLIDVEEISDPQVEQETTAEGNESNRLSDLRFEVLNHHDAHRMSPVGENNFTYDKAHADHIATHIDFRQHLREQLISNNTSSEDKILCTYLVDCVDEDGFLTEAFEDLKRNLPRGSDWLEKDFERARRILQNLEPMGIGSKHLLDYLHLQVANLPIAEKTKTTANKILTQHLTLLANFNFKKISTLLDCDIADVEDASKIISNLSPKPLSSEWEDHARYVKPDLLAEKFNNEWVIRLNSEHIPKIGINKDYARLIQSEKNGDADILKEYLKQAKNIQRSVDQRHETLMRVATEILNVQLSFFEEGPKGLLPLNLQTISEVLGLHESTVSRATSGKYVSTPRGTYELKYFFSNAIGDKSEMSSTHVKDVIKKIIRSENPECPLSDSAIQKFLSNKGIDIARRTVAKYRENQKILPSQMRKKVYIK